MSLLSRETVVNGGSFSDNCHVAGILTELIFGVPVYWFADWQIEFVHPFHGFRRHEDNKYVKRTLARAARIFALQWWVILF